VMRAPDGRRPTRNYTSRSLGYHVELLSAPSGSPA
jgi:hypothetical protein